MRPPTSKAGGGHAFADTAVFGEILFFFRKMRRHHAIYHMAERIRAVRKFLICPLLEERLIVRERIVRTADRIAYLCHDYDDSLRAGLIKEGDLPAEVYDKLGTDTSRMITSMVSDMIMTSQGAGDILQSAAIKQAMDTFREFMFTHIYHSDKLSREREQAAFVLRELYHYFLDNFAQLPKEFIKREARWGRQKIVTDYVAGLTDSYAVALFEEIFVPPVWQGLKKIKKDIDKTGRIL